MTQVFLVESLVEAFARAWAQVDGWGDRFDACKADESIEGVEGIYHQYLISARTLLRLIDFPSLGVAIVPREATEKMAEALRRAQGQCSPVLNHRQLVTAAISAGEIKP